MNNVSSERVEQVALGAGRWLTLKHAEVLLLALALFATVAMSAMTLRQTTRHFQLERTSAFVTRFNSQELVTIREEVDRWVESKETAKRLYERSGIGSAGSTAASPNDNSDAKQALAMVAKLRTMANFFQEFGTAIKVGSLDERYAHDLLGAVCVRYANDLRQFIEESRIVRGRPQAYEEVFLLEATMKALDR